MSNPYLAYYANQAGSGLAGFQGVRYQRGHGFFSSIFQNVLRPLAKYLGKKALSTGVEIGSDILKGEDIKESAKKRLKTTGKSIVNDAIERAKNFAQTGSGGKRRRKRKYKKSKGKLKKDSKKLAKNKKKTSKKSKKKPVKRKKAVSKHLKHIFT